MMSKYKIMMDGKEKGFINTDDPDRFATRNYPNWGYAVDEEKREIHIGPSVILAQKVIQRVKEQQK